MPRHKQIILAAKSIAKSLDCPYISSVHLLAAILQQDPEETLGRHFLNFCHIDFDWFMRRLGQMSTPPPNDFKYVVRWFHRYSMRHEDRYCTECLLLSILPMPYVQDVLNHRDVKFSWLYDGCLEAWIDKAPEPTEQDIEEIAKELGRSVKDPKTIFRERYKVTPCGKCGKWMRFLSLFRKVQK